MKQKYIYSLLIVLIVLFLGSIPFWLEKEAPEKKVVDWTPTFKKMQTKPYANSALFALIEDIFPDKDIKIKDDISPGDSSLYQFADKYNFFYVNREMDYEKNPATDLLGFVENGGSAFIACQEYNYMLSEGLGFSLNTQEDSTMAAFNFTNPALKAKSAYEYPNLLDYSYFAEYNVASTTVLARDTHGYAVFLKILYGKGYFYVSSLPLAFTNFGMIESNHHQFIAKSLSYLPIKHILWDDMPLYVPQNPSNTGNTTIGIKELAFLKKHPALWWAFLLSLAAVLVFIVFRAKREQKPIVVLKKERNLSIDLARTIGRLYFNHQDHKNLAEKKIKYLYDFIRNHLQIPIQQIDEETILRLFQKTNASKEELYLLFESIKSCKESGQISENELILLNTQINDFKKKCI